MLRRRVNFLFFFCFVLFCFLFFSFVLFEKEKNHSSLFIENIFGFLEGVVQKQVVVRCNGNKRVSRMPGNMEALLGEINIFRVEIGRCSGACREELLPAALSGFDEGALDDLWLRDVVDVELVVVRASHQMRTVGRETTFKLVEDAVVFVEVAQLRTEMVMDLDRSKWMAVHIHIPDLESEVVAREDVAAVRRESDIRNGGDDFGEERLVAGVLFLFEGLGVRVTESRLAHVTQFDDALAAAIDQ